MDNAELIAELDFRSAGIVSQIDILKDDLKNLQSVIKIFTLFKPKEVALNAINESPDKIWTVDGIADELRSVHNIRKLDTKGLEGKTFIQISRSVLNNLVRTCVLERAGRGQYKGISEDSPDKIEGADFEDVVKAMLNTPPQPRKKPAPKKTPPQKESILPAASDGEIAEEEIKETLKEVSQSTTVPRNNRASEKPVSKGPDGLDKHERHIKKQKERGLCTKCSRPATTKTLCDYHRQKKRESNIQQGLIGKRNVDIDGYGDDFYNSARGL